MGNCCPQHQVGEVAELRLPVLLVPEGPAKQQEGAEALPASNPTPRHWLDLKWDKFEVPPFDLTTEEREKWEKLGGRDIEPLLEHVDLVDLRFVIENTEAGRPIPRWQDVPVGARIHAGNMHRIQKCGWDGLGSFVLAVLVLSYPWLDAGHPDKQVKTLKRLLPALKAFLSCIGDDERSTVGLMMDYPCLPQKSTAGDDDRSTEEIARFKRGLSTINGWYVHPRTTVIIFDVEMPAQNTGHTNLRPHCQRGWCAFEHRASSIVKNAGCLWSLRGFESEEGSMLLYCHQMFNARANAERPAPMSPECFGKVLREGVANGELAFTARADVEVVAEQYSKAFEAAFSSVANLNYAGLGWADEQMKSLAQAITYAREHGGLTQCNDVMVVNNCNSEAGLLALIEALAGTGCKLVACDNGCSQAGKAAVRKAAKDSNAKVDIW